MNRLCDANLNYLSSHSAEDKIVDEHCFIDMDCVKDDHCIKGFEADVLDNLEAEVDIPCNILQEEHYLLVLLVIF
jgi:hypothetical protein